MEKPLSGVSPADKIDQKILKRLLDEGYLRIRAVKALMFTGGQSYDLAVKWYDNLNNSLIRLG